jgi:fucose permease
VDQPVDQPFEQPADQPVERSLHRPRSEEESPRLFGTAATIAAFCGFVLLGALQAYYGPAIPALRSKFGVAPSGAGLALSMYFGGAVTGVLVGGFVHRHTRNSRLLISSFLVMGLGALGFALAPAWPVALAASLVSGFGAGGMDYGLNQLFSIGFGRRSSAMLSILNAFYGVGAICGPLAISLLGATHYPAAFAGTAALLAVACWFLRGVRDLPQGGLTLVPTASAAESATAHAPVSATESAATSASAAESAASATKSATAPTAASSTESGSKPGPAAAPAASTPATAPAPATSAARSPMLPMLVIGAFLTLYALQVTVETGVGAWEPTYLQLLGHGADFAANATSGFWLMLTVGRFLVAPLTLRWSEPTIVWVSCLGTTVSLALAPIPGLAPYAFASAGLFNAPVFPAGLPWLNRSTRVHWAGTGAILTANIGGAAAGPLLGLGIEVFGSGSVPWSLTAVSTVCFALALWLRRATRSVGPGAAPAATRQGVAAPDPACTAPKP